MASSPSSNYSLGSSSSEEDLVADAQVVASAYAMTVADLCEVYVRVPDLLTLFPRLSPIFPALGNASVVTNMTIREILEKVAAIVTSSTTPIPAASQPVSSSLSMSSRIRDLSHRIIDLRYDVRCRRTEVNMLRCRVEQLEQELSESRRQQLRNVRPRLQ